MGILERLQADYARFPENQSYDLYAADVFFKDPMTKFSGIEQYQKMIGFIQTYFLGVTMELHDINQSNDMIYTRWTLKWTAPFPWKPKMAISGRSELKLNPEGLVCSHVDYWDCSRWAVLKQVFA
ncbi:MAG: DUF2358 domain-containing protein [Cyanobacteria bacterium P01_F01_bin.42]